MSRPDVLPSDPAAPAPAGPESRVRRVLVCGHTSFAAQGLVDRLARAGHAVTCFSRGEPARAGNVVTGPVLEMHENPFLDAPFDTVINYVLLKDEGTEPNLRYVRALIEFCRGHGVGHLIHVSSVSVYCGSVRIVTEDAAVERDPARKGSYGGLKVATENCLAEHLAPSTRLTVVRPGFILGRGVVSPIVGMAVRLPGDRLLLLGSKRNTVPLISRDLVNEALARLVAGPPGAARESVLLVDRDSPSRREYLEACCRLLGAGRGVTSRPVWLWRLAGWGGELLARTLRLGVRVNRLIAGACRVQRFDAAASEKRLGMSFKTDWRALLRESLDAQEPNFVVPPKAIGPGSLPFDGVAYVGFGRIVRQKHLPALRRLGYGGGVEAFDVRDFEDEDGHKVRAVGGARLAGRGLAVVATPGPSHTAALACLAAWQGPVLVEKPLCYSRGDLGRWLAFAASRGGRVYVCHNYRFKRNVLEMTDALAHFNPGRLHHVHVDFQSPPVAAERAAWARREREARTLLMDYGVHFLDLACMWGQGPWQAGNTRHKLDARGHTALIEGRLGSDAYSVSFLLRQGFMPRRARLTFTFQNYLVSLGFFPDTCAVQMSDDGPAFHRREARASTRATLRKIADRLLRRDSDASHAAVYAALAAESAAASGLRVEALRGFYGALFEVAGAVYGEAPCATPP